MHEPRPGREPRPLEPLVDDWRPSTSKGRYPELPAVLQLDPAGALDEVTGAIRELQEHPWAEREMQIVARRFPAVGKPPTLAAVGRPLRLGRERVRQMTVRGLRRIRSRVQSRRRS